MSYAITRKDTIFDHVDLWLAGAITAAVIVRLIHLNEAALWHDEVQTAEWVSLSWQDMMWTIFYGGYGNNHLPFYFIVLKTWAAVTGTDAWLLRFPSVVFSVMTVMLTAEIARRFVDRRCMRWAAWLAALSPFLVHHAQEARMYALMSLLAALAVLLLVRFLDRHTARLGLAFVLVNFALLATHYYSVFFVAGELAVLMLVRPRPISAWLPATAAVGLGLVAIVLAAQIFPSHAAGEIYELGALVLPGVLWSLVSGYTLIPSSLELHAQGAEVVLYYLPIALVAAVPIGLCLFYGLVTLPSTSRLIVLVLIGFCLAGPFLVYLLFSDIAINPRYFAPALPLVVVLLAAGAGTRGAHALRASLGLATLLIMGWAALLHLANPGHGREDVRSAGIWLGEHVAANEQILVTSEEMAYLARYHWPQHRPRLYPDRAEQRLDRATLAEQIPFDGRRRVYYVFGRAWLTDPDGSLRNVLKSRYQVCPGAEFRGVQILCIARP